MIKEVCVDQLFDAIKAYHAGADIIELCSNLNADGLTPSLDTYTQLRSEIDIPIKVMIRIATNNHVYSDDEIEMMRQISKSFNAEGAKNFVFGALTEDGKINLKALDHVFSEISFDSLTFHKAIDQTKEILGACTTLKGCPTKVTHVLSSGACTTAKEGISKLRQMNSILSPEIQLIAAGSITDSNLNDIHNALNISHYHGKRILQY